MRNTTINKNVLLAKLRENREKHIREYNELYEKYKEMAIEALNQAKKEALRTINAALSLMEKSSSKEPAGLDIANLGGFFQYIFKPENHEKDYDMAIAMIEVEVHEVIVLPADQFQCFYMDDWSWRGQFERVKATAAAFPARR